MDKDKLLKEVVRVASSRAPTFMMNMRARGSRNRAVEMSPQEAQKYQQSKGKRDVDIMKGKGQRVVYQKERTPVTVQVGSSSVTGYQTKKVKKKLDKR